MSDACPNCGRADAVYVHGHTQCVRCGCVLVPCCNGDCAIDGSDSGQRALASRVEWSVVRATLMILVLFAAGCTTGDSSQATTQRVSETPERTGETVPDRSEPNVNPRRRLQEATHLAVTPSESLARGVRFLIENQNEDGSWGSFVSLRTREIYLGNLSSHRAFHDATTALCLMALLEPSRDDDQALAAVERGIAYVLASQPAGRAQGDTFYDTWAHTYLTQCLARVFADERFAAQREKVGELAVREIALLAERQMLEGGFGYYDFGNTLKSPSGDQSTSFNAGAALVALYEAQQAGLPVPDEVIAGALGALQRLRLPSGAYIYGEYARNNPAAGYNKVKGSLGRSQPCNLALWLYRDQIAQPISLDDLKRGAEVMRDEHHFMEIGRGRPVPHEAWYSTAGYYYLFGHYYMARVTSELTTTDRESLRTWLTQNMVAIQDPGGSWTDFPLYGYHRCYGAAFGVLTLIECGVFMP